MRKLFHLAGHPLSIIVQVDVEKGCLPSPEELKYKILIKAKRSKKIDKEEKNVKKSSLIEHSTSGSQEKVSSEDCLKSPLKATMQMAKKISVGISRGSSPEEISGNDNKNIPGVESSQDKEENPDGVVKDSDQGNVGDEEEDENRSEDETSSNRLSTASNESIKDESETLNEENVKDTENPVENVSGQLNSIINCLEATKFVQLDDPDRKFWQMFSLKEHPAENLGNKQETAMKLVVLTQSGLARVYPNATRVDSSNYNPIPFWMR